MPKLATLVFMTGGPLEKVHTYDETVATRHTFLFNLICTQKHPFITLLVYDTLENPMHHITPMPQLTVTLSPSRPQVVSSE